MSLPETSTHQPNPKRSSLVSRNNSIAGKRSEFVFPLGNDSELASMIRHRKDLVGKRILCIPENPSSIGTPSPSSISSLFWCPSVFRAVTSRNKNQHESKWPLWCPKHHHHQPSQQAIISAIEASNQRSATVNNKTATTICDVSNNRHRGKVNKNSVNSQKGSSSQSNCDKSSYSVFRAKKSNTASSVDKTKTSAPQILPPLPPPPLTQIESNPSDSDLKHASCELCDRQDTHDVSIDGPLNNDSKSVNYHQFQKAKSDQLESADLASSDRQLYLGSLPWRVGTIRAMNHYDSRDRSAKLMIEFDLLEWRTRDWYSLCDKTDYGNKSGDQSSVNCLSNQSAFKVFLIECSACCLNRHLAPTGRDKLWPALMFEPLLDKLGLFNSSSNRGVKLRAVEYLEPDRNNYDGSQPICDISRIANELDTEFSKTQSLSIQTHASDYNVEAPNDHEPKRVSSIDQERLDGEDDKLYNGCNCWSPRVTFVDDSQVYKLHRKDAIFSDKDSSLKQPSPEQILESSGRDEDDKSTSPKAKRHKSDQRSTIINIEQSHLSSFKSFLRFYHYVYITKIRELQSNSLTVCQKSLEVYDNDSKMNQVIHSKPTSSEPVNCNHLLEAVLKYPSLYHVLREWHFYQDAQSLLGNTYTAGLLVGNRVKVYRRSGTTQWFTAVIISYDSRNALLTLIDDTVLEQHHEDPTLLEMHLIDNERLVKSIIEGDDESSAVSAVRRRAPRANQQRQVSAGNASMNTQVAMANGIGQTTSSSSSNSSGGLGSTGSGASVGISAALPGSSKTSAQLINPANATATPHPSTSNMVNRAGKPHNKSLSVVAAIASPAMSPTAQHTCASSSANSTFSTLTGAQAQAHHHHHHHHHHLHHHHHHHHHHHQQQPHQQQPRPSDGQRNKSKGNTNLDNSTYLVETHEYPFKRNVATRRVSSDYFWRPRNPSKDNLSPDRYETLGSDLLAGRVNSHGECDTGNAELSRDSLFTNWSSLPTDNLSSSRFLMKIGRLRSSRRDGKDFVLHRLRLEALGEQPQLQLEHRPLEQATRQLAGNDINSNVPTKLEVCPEPALVGSPVDMQSSTSSSSLNSSSVSPGGALLMQSVISAAATMPSPALQSSTQASLPTQSDTSLLRAAVSPSTLQVAQSRREDGQTTGKGSRDE